MSLWKRLKNLWRLSGLDNYYPLPADSVKQTYVSLKKDFSGTKRLATIMEDTLPVTFEQEHDHTS